MRNTKKSTIAGLILVALLLLPALSFAAEVAQGICKSLDNDKKVLIIEEYDTDMDAENKYGKPTGVISEFDIATAKIGITPESGDILRIAYVLEGENKKAIKVMNVSKQDIMKK